MNNLKKMIAGLLSVAVLVPPCTSCAGKKVNESIPSETQERITVPAETDEEKTEAETEISVETADSVQKEEATEIIYDISGTEITWLADYDLNPQENGTRSVALSLFEDVYGGKVNFVYARKENRLSKLATMILAGDEVDMFPYDFSSLPDGVANNQYEALDPYFDYLGMNSEIWDGMRETADRLEYDGKHYVIPYALSNPSLITYSRKMIEENDLDDPYELYKKGDWDWDTFYSMMTDFKKSHEGGYGISGDFSKALIQSTGHTAVNYENGLFSNNIDDPEIKDAELFLRKIADNNLYYRGWTGHFPLDSSTLFFAMPDWSLRESNALNSSDKDLMAVPFPKCPDSDRYYLSCDFSAKMLVKNSVKGEAVATYIKCERLAETQEQYKELARKYALKTDKTEDGIIRGYITEEQYDAVQEYKDPSVITPAIDFAYGMGERMYCDTDYTSRGVMNWLETGLLNGHYETWTELRDAWAGAVNEEVDRFNSYSS